MQYCCFYKKDFFILSLNFFKKIIFMRSSLFVKNFCTFIEDFFQEIVFFKSMLHKWPLVWWRLLPLWLETGFLGQPKSQTSVCTEQICWQKRCFPWQPAKKHELTNGLSSKVMAYNKEGKLFLIEILKFIIMKRFTMIKRR